MSEYRPNELKLKISVDSKSLEELQDLLSNLEELVGKIEQMIDTVIERMFIIEEVE
jgi:hypothetical protein